MDALEVIFTRRSIRKYTSENVSEEAITCILKAAMSAPSARNAQPWRFIVVRSQEQRDGIAACNQYAHMAKSAPVCIVVCADLKAELSEGYWPQDCAAALENMLLAARALHLGTVWTGVYPKEDRVSGMKQLFALPEHIMPLGVVVLGHPAEKFKEQDRYDAKKIHQERWSA